MTPDVILSTVVTLNYTEASSLNKVVNPLTELNDMCTCFPPHLDNAEMQKTKDAHLFQCRSIGDLNLLLKTVVYHFVH